MKIWDLRQGHILYSLYGHEGAANSVSFSPNGDFFTTSGNDTIVMCWKSNLNEIDTEVIDEIGGTATKAMAPTATSKPLLPQANPTLKQRPSSARAVGAAAQVSHQKPAKVDSPTKSNKKPDNSVRSYQPPLTPSVHQQSAVKTGNAFAQHNSDAQIGAVHNTGNGVAGSGEELALTLEKVVSQLDIISRTLQVLE